MVQGQFESLERMSASRQVTTGQAVVRGTYIPVEWVLDHLASYSDLDKLLDAFPELTQDERRAVLAYARDQVCQSRENGESASQPSIASPEAFYKQLSSRSDIREILTRLAK